MSNMPTREELEELKSDELRAFAGGAIIAGLMSFIITVGFVILLIASINSIFLNIMTLGVSVFSTYLVFKGFSNAISRSVRIYTMVYDILEKRGHNG